MAITIDTLEKKAGELKDLAEDLKGKIEDMVSAKEEALSNEESRNSPNEERLEKYNSQISILEEVSQNLDDAIDRLNEVESLVSGWER